MEEEERKGRSNGMSSPPTDVGSNVFILCVYLLTFLCVCRCENKHNTSDCEIRALRGECDSNPGFMIGQCTRTCLGCGQTDPGLLHDSDSAVNNNCIKQEKQKNILKLASNNDEDDDVWLDGAMLGRWTCN